ncbi:hypothetical protein Tco_1438704 [Tanacetum coccineum]
MAVLESCPKHNMVAYLEKTDGNAEFHEIIDFLARSSFTLCSHCLIAGKPVSISEASIRSDLLFDDADGIDSLPILRILVEIIEGQSSSDRFPVQWNLIGGREGNLPSEPSVHYDPLFDEIADDTLGYMFSLAVGSTKDERKVKEMNEGAKELRTERIKEVGIMDSENNGRNICLARVEQRISSPGWRLSCYFLSQWNFRAFKYLLDAYSEVTMGRKLSLFLWGEFKDNVWKSSKEENDQVTSGIKSAKFGEVITWRFMKRC